MSRLVEDLLATARRDAAGLADTDVDIGLIAREARGDFLALAASSSARGGSTFLLSRPPPATNPLAIL
jgi:hypothetical protein